MAFGNSKPVAPPHELFWMAGLLFLVAGSFLVLLIYISVSGPGDLVRAKSWEIDEPALIDWMAKSAEAEETFRREYEQEPENPEVYASLESAIGYQRQLKAMDPENAFGSTTRLHMLIKLLEGTKGSALQRAIKSNGNQAADLVARGDSLSAVPLLEEALANQEWINNHLRDSPYVDLGEVTRLKQWLANLQTKDAVSEVEALVGEAKAAYASSDWEKAEQLFDRALGIQQSINLNMPESSHVRWRLVEELKDYQERIEAARLNQRIEELLSSSADGVGSERLRMAFNLQGLLNEKFSSSEFANADRFQAMRDSLESDKSQAKAALLVQQYEALASHLRSRAWEPARRSLFELQDCVDVFIGEFSMNLLPVADLKERVDWLVASQQKWERISHGVKAHMVAHPKLPITMYKTEVDQELFETVMGSNPSRWVGSELPVDSVSLFDAQLFCKRLGWVLGREVVLPKLDWLGFLSGVDLEEQELWFSHRSRFRSHPVGLSKSEHGFYDLFGNLEEWILISGDLEEAALYGGCGADSFSKVVHEPVNKVSSNFRSRWTGFRFCILGDHFIHSPTSN